MIHILPDLFKSVPLIILLAFSLTFAVDPLCVAVAPLILRNAPKQGLATKQGEKTVLDLKSDQY